MENYSVKKFSDLTGVTVRTLHLYDQIGLLTPALRTAAGYRLYGTKELYRMQQILFYRELDFSLEQIRGILDYPDFDLVTALEEHKIALVEKGKHLAILLQTIDKTIDNIKNGTKMTPDELYQGFTQEQADGMRNEAVATYGQEAVEHSEVSLMAIGKEAFAGLKAENIQIAEELYHLQGNDPKSEPVQKMIAKHYEIIRKFWGTYENADKQAEAYAGLGQLYATDERFTLTGGKADLPFGQFMSIAMKYFAETGLKP